MKHNNELDFSIAVLIVLVILVHIVNFGNLYPLAKSSILAFMMPTFLFITGYLVNIDKSIKDFLRYLLQIFLPYIIFVMGYAVLSLYLPVRDGIETLDWPTIVNVLCVKSIGPYWFFHTMIVCGTIYYTVFQTFRSLSTAAKYSLFAAVLIAVALWTPILNIKAAVYYFVGVGIRLYVGDFSRVYVKSLWPALPFGLLISNPAFHDWGAISILICAVCFLCFSSFLFTFFKGRAKTVAEYIGRNTFPIYVFHPIFTMLSKFLLPFFRFEPTGLLHAFFTIVMCIAGSLCMAKLMDRTRLSFLLGRKRILR